MRRGAKSAPVGGGDGTPNASALNVSPPQQMGNLFLIFGKTDSGATVTVNGESADVEPDGTFRKTITIDRDGYAMLIVKATDASGNETVKRIKVFVETL